MSQRTSGKYTVIKFKQLPQNGMYEFQCVPSSWIKCYNDDNQVTVAYPTENTEAIPKKIRKATDPPLKWPLFPAISIAELGSYLDWMPITKFIQENDYLDILDLKNKLHQSELYKNINSEGGKQPLINLSFEASTSRQSHDTEDSSQMKKENSCGKRLFNEDSRYSKISRMNDFQFQKEPQVPPSPSRHENPISAERRDNNRQLSESISISKSVSQLLCSDSSDSDSENEVRRQKDEYQMENLSPHKSKSSTPVQQIDKASLVRLRKLCKQMNLIAIDIRSVTHEILDEK